MYSIFISSALVLVLFAATTINLGAALGRKHVGDHEGYAGLCLALAIGSLAVGVIGLAVWIIPGSKTLVAGLLLGLSNLICGWCNLKHRHYFNELVIARWFPLAVWIGVSLSLLLIVLVPIKQPRALADGLYAFKNWTLAVRIQFLAGNLPADNALPAFVAEYMARDTSFAAARPIMPGQEVSNRPVLQALQYLPFRVLFGTTEPAPSPYPTYRYVGTVWPDTSVLIDDRSFAHYLAVAIPLNALLIVALAALVAHFKVPYARFVLLAFTAFSPYFLTHAMFTWPKNLAAFYIVTAASVFLGRFSVWWAGLFVGLAYLAHPYAIVFVGVLALAAAIELVRMRAFPNTPPLLGRPLTPAQGLALIVLPLVAVALWLAWTNLMLGIRSDLIEQNIGQMSDLRSAIWARVRNSANLVFPTAFLAPEFRNNAFTRTYLINLVSAVGIVPLLLMPWALLRTARFEPMQTLGFGLLPGALLIAAFGSPFAVPMLHGWQAIWPGLLVLTLSATAREFGRPVLLLAVLIHLMLGLFVIGLRVNEIWWRPMAAAAIGYIDPAPIDG